MRYPINIITWQSREILLLPELPIKWTTIQVTRTHVRHSKYKTDAWLPVFGNHPRANIGTSEGDCEYYDYLNSITGTKAFKEALHVLKSDQWICLICFCSEYEKCHRRVLLEWLVSNYPEYFMKYDVFSIIPKLHQK